MVRCLSKDSGFADDFKQQRVVGLRRFFGGFGGPLIAQAGTVTFKNASTIP